MFAYNDITNAARQGARAAIVNQDKTAAKNRVIQMATSSGLKPTDIDVAIRDQRRRDLPRHGRASIRSLARSTSPSATTGRPITPVIGNIVGPMTVTATTQMPIERIFP